MGAGMRLHARALRRGVRLWSLVALTLALAGCSSTGGSSDSGLGQNGSTLPNRPRPAPQSGGDYLATSDLRTLYQAILEVYVDPVDPRVVVAGALKGAHQAAATSGLLPMESGVFDTAGL